MNRRESIRALALGLAAVATGNHLLLAAEKKKMTVYKSPSCGCCKDWVKHIRNAGFDVHAIDVDDVAPYKRKYGVPVSLESCHTGIIGGYAFEGHVPADVIQKFLREKRQEARGLAVPGMVVGSPGMEVGNRKERYDVVMFKSDGRTVIYARR